MRVIELVQFGILTVDRQCVLSQIICSYTEEIYFFRKLTADHDRSGSFDHNAKLHIFFIRDALILQFFLHFRNDFLDPEHFIHGNDHREHDRNVAKHGCTIKCAQLCLKNLRSCKADADRAVPKRRILFFIQSEIINLFVCTYIKCADDDFLSCHALRHLFVH